MYPGFTFSGITCCVALLYSISLLGNVQQPVLFTCRFIKLGI